MSWSAALLGFAAVAGVLTIIPGLDTALVLRTALIQGRGRAFATALGTLTGALVWGAGAAAGVSALLTASTIGYSIVRIAGAAYLVWLGYRFLRSAMSHQTDDEESESTRGGGPRSPWRCWQRGLLTNLLNPKIGAFGAYSVRRLLSRRSTRRAMDASTGGVLIGFGVKLGLTAR
jgi:threonine/homoserine/homoserine lactone efflux protein